MQRSAYFARIMASVKTGGVIPAPRTARPVLATLNLTENCQSRCLMCDYWRETQRNVINGERAVSLIQEFRSIGVTSLRFLGGEPLLRKDLFSILERVSDTRFKRVTLATNGLLLGRLSQEINRSSITHITVSLDGYGKGHDEIRGVPGGFDVIVEGLTRITGKRIKVAALVTRSLSEEIDALLNLCSHKGWNFDLVLPSFDLPYARQTQSVAALEELWPSPSEARIILTKVQAHGYMSSSLAEAALNYLIHRVYPQEACVLGHIQLQVRANGDLLSGCYDLKPIGNILDQSVAEILGSTEYRQRLRQMLAMDCPGCVCGWQISYLAQRPLGSLPYVIRRM